MTDNTHSQDSEVNASTNYEKLASDSLGFIFIGPSGSGKSTLRNKLCDSSREEFEFVKYQHLTTRQKRPEEGDEYLFLDEEAFYRWEQTDLVLFENESYGNRFMTLWPKKLSKHQFYIYILLPEAALKLKQLFPNTKIIQIVPDDKSDLREVILKRDPAISSVELQRRISQIEAEISEGAKIADEIFVNTAGISHSVRELRGLLLKYV